MARDAIRQQSPAAHETGSDSALLRALLHDGSVAFACYGADGRYRQVSRALAEINGLSVEEHLGRLPSEILPGELGEQVEESVARVVATGKSWREPEQRWDIRPWNLICTAGGIDSHIHFICPGASSVTGSGG